MDTDKIFGEKTWEDLRRVLANYFWQRFYDISPDDVDDACSHATSDLLSYWIDLPTSVHEDDPQRTWAYAMWRAKHVGATYIHKLLKRRVETSSLDDENPEYESWAIEPPDLDENQERQANIRTFLGSLSDDDLRDVVGPVLKGESVRAQARRTHTYPMKVWRTRTRGLDRLYVHACKMGVWS